MSIVAQYTQSGEAHGLINTLPNYVPFDDFKHMAPDIKAKVEKEKKEDARMVEVKYINMRNRHERLEKPYCRYAGDPIHMYRLIPGYTYKLPYGFIKEVGEVKNPIRSGLISVDGTDLNKDGSPLAKDQEGEALHLLIPAKFA
jgi:hypothetical protein